jgi:hypothetical protein
VRTRVLSSLAAAQGMADSVMKTSCEQESSYLKGSRGRAPVIASAALAFVMLGCGSAQLKSSPTAVRVAPAVARPGADVVGAAGTVKRESAKQAARAGEREASVPAGARRGPVVRAPSRVQPGRQRGRVALGTLVWAGHPLPAAHLLATAITYAWGRNASSTTDSPARSRRSARRTPARSTITMETATVTEPERLRTSAARERSLVTLRKVATVATTTPSSIRARTFIRRLAAATA